MNPYITVVYKPEIYLKDNHFEISIEQGRILYKTPSYELASKMLPENIQSEIIGLTIYLPNTDGSQFLYTLKEGEIGDHPMILRTTSDC